VLMVITNRVVIYTNTPGCPVWKMVPFISIRDSKGKASYDVAVSELSICVLLFFHSWHLTNNFEIGMCSQSHFTSLIYCYILQPLTSVVYLPSL
jgi:hypothetical protein